MSKSSLLPILETFQTPLASLPTTQGGGSLASGDLAMLELDPRQITPDGSTGWACRVPSRFFGPGPLPEGEMPGSLLEGQFVLGPPGQAHEHIREGGAGAYSLWHSPDAGSVLVVFSVPDGSDPRSNGRRYALVNQTLVYANDWERWQLKRWANHSRGHYFLERGGDRVAPPLFANLGLTDLCNFRCGICGSQNMSHPVNRRHMDIRIFSMVAETLFPVLAVVEFNSRGEPLMHPEIEKILATVREYDLYFRLQTNGSQFQPRKIAWLTRMKGEVSVSLDATGSLFEAARAGGRWKQVEQGVRALADARDPARLGLALYPTLTAKTIEGAPDLVRWAAEIGVDRIDFHLYDPIYGGAETVPDLSQLDSLRREVAALDPSHPLQVFLDYECIAPGEAPPRLTPHQMRYANIPRRLDQGGHREFTCMAPVQYVDIDLDGGVCVCCQLQDRKIGNALTVEAFADCWFGAEYEAVRRRLQRDHDEPLYETCRGCVQRYTG